MKCKENILIFKIRNLAAKISVTDKCHVEAFCNYLSCGGWDRTSGNLINSQAPCHLGTPQKFSSSSHRFRFIIFTSISFLPSFSFTVPTIRAITPAGPFYTGKFSIRSSCLFYTLTYISSFFSFVRYIDSI